MTLSAVPWRLDRLSAGAREAAEIASLGAGLSLSLWLTRLIEETCADEGLIARAGSSQPLTLQPVPAAAPPDPAPAAPLPAEAAVLASAAANDDAAQLILPLDANTTMLPVELLEAGAVGTRRRSEEVPDALVADIAKHNIGKPLLVRRSATNAEHFEIIAGRRRWRAAQRAGMAQLPAIIVAMSDGEAILASLAENLGRADLSPIDEAHAYLRLLTQCGLQPAEITAATGHDRQHLVRTMRLLGLPPAVRQLIDAGQLSAEHGSALLDAGDPAALAETIIAEGWSVAELRQRMATERRAP